MRADAQQNRVRIIEVAADALRRDSGTSLSAIGKLAGVGQGTLYRHFPDRDALIWAVAEREVEDLITGAYQLIENEPPLRALREWTLQLAHFALNKARLGGAVIDPNSLQEKRSRPGYDRVEKALETLLEVNRDAGTIRPDVTTEDFSDLVAALWLLRPSDTADDRAERLVNLILIAISA